MANPSNRPHLHRFYDLLARLADARTAPEKFSEYDWRQPALRGVYFFLDPTERNSIGDLARVVRVGTHALQDSEESVHDRLRAHWGYHDGSGSVDRSIFRKHVGRALLQREALAASGWGDLRPMRGDTQSEFTTVEPAISAYIRALQVLVLPVQYPATLDTDRERIEAGAIGLLTSRKPGVHPEDITTMWLGRQSPSPEISKGGLWNVRHAREPWGVDFLDRMEVYVKAAEKLGPIQYSLPDVDEDVDRSRD